MIKAKTHYVSVGGHEYLVMAQTKAGAIRDVVAHIMQSLTHEAYADLATGEQIYRAGEQGVEIIGSERYKNKVDPNQLPLTGLPETAGPLP